MQCCKEQQLSVALRFQQTTKISRPTEAERELKIGGGGRIRTTEAEATDLQSAPFDRSGTPPKYKPVKNRLFLMELVDRLELPTC